MIVRSYTGTNSIRPEHIIRLILDTPSVSAEHIIRKLGAFHPKHPDFFVKNIRAFRQNAGIFQANAHHSAC